MRLDTPLDEATEQQLVYLQTTTQQNVDEIIKQSLNLYYQHVKKKGMDNVQQLLDSDFVGCAEGPEDLSTHYKHYFSQELSNKHDHR